MIDLSKNNPPLDLRYRIERYKRDNSPYLIDTGGVLCISGIVCKNKPLQSYIRDNTTEQDLFDTPLVQLMIALLKDISHIIEGCQISYTYQNKFVMFFRVQEDLYRDNIISLVASRIVNFLGEYYDNPMTLVSAYQVPVEEVKNILAYHKMSWTAKRNRILGSHYLGIPVLDTSRTHTEILELCKSRGFSILDLSTSLQNGFAYSPYDNE